MKNKKIVVFSVVIIVCAIVVLIFIRYKSTSIDLRSISGEIIITNPNSSDTGSGKGLKIYNLNSGESADVLNETTFTHPIFNNAKDKIMAVSGNSIIEYNRKSKDLKTIVSDKTDSTPYSNVKYVPGDENKISFTRGNELYLFDKTTKKQNLIAYVYSYSWDKDGKSFLFSKNGKVCRYNIVTNKIAELFTGDEPEYSSDNKYIAYITVPRVGTKDILVIREVATDKEWKYESRGIYYYKFSPDNEYIAILEENTSLKWIFGQEIKILNFRNSKTAKLVEHISSGHYSSFDWK